MLHEEMIIASANYAGIYPAMRRLESFRSFWLRRHLLTLDFSEGERTWVERQSLDIKRTIFQNYYQDEDIYVYVPLGWRKKGPYLTFDCVLNDGNSASLMGKAFNEGYALWMFDDMCRAFGIDSRDIPTCLREHVAHIIADQSVDDDWSFCKWHTPYLHRNLWNRLIKYNPEMEGYLQQIRTHHFVAVKINACRDFSIVKFSERKTGVWRDELAESRLVDYLTLRQGKIVDTIPAESVKVIMPHDVRIKSGYGNYTLLPGRTYLARHRTMTVYSDRWAADHERPLPFKASGISWIIWFSPTRSPIIAPTMWLSLVAMMACMLWAFLGIAYRYTRPL